MKKRICVIFGGQNSEHEVSLRSATCVIENIDHDKYDVIMVGITKQGEWFYYTGPIADIASGAWSHHQAKTPAILTPDPSFGGLLLLTSASEINDDPCITKHPQHSLPIVPLDLIFPVIHGKNAEDGTIQGLFELSNIPYVGCGVLSSAVCMDKAIAHRILQNAGINKTNLIALHDSDERLKSPQELTQQLEESLGYPMFVKPVNEGSSVGIKKVKNQTELLPAINYAFQYDRKIVIEQMVAGREIECAVWGNESPQASHSLGEIIPTRDFYDYEGKYLDDSVGLKSPAQLPIEVIEQVRTIALAAYKALDCRGLARIDFFVTSEGIPIVNEINTLPGFTSISMYPRLFEDDGISIPRLLDNLIDSAFSYHQR